MSHLNEGLSPVHGAGGHNYSPPVTPQDSQLSATAKQLLLTHANINTQDVLSPIQQTYMYRASAHRESYNEREIMVDDIGKAFDGLERNKPD